MSHVFMEGPPPKIAHGYGKFPHDGRVIICRINDKEHPMRWGVGKSRVDVGLTGRMIWGWIWADANPRPPSERMASPVLDIRYVEDWRLSPIQEPPPETVQRIGGAPWPMACAPRDGREVVLFFGDAWVLAYWAEKRRLYEYQIGVPGSGDEVESPGWVGACSDTGLFDEPDGWRWPGHDDRSQSEEAPSVIGVDMGQDCSSVDPDKWAADADLYAMPMDAASEAVLGTVTRVFVPKPSRDEEPAVMLNGRPVPASLFTPQELDNMEPAGIYTRPLGGTVWQPFATRSYGEAVQLVERNNQQYRGVSEWMVGVPCKARAKR